MLVGYAYKTLSIEAIIAATFFYLLGGNVNVATANMHAIITDVSKDPSQRTIILSYFHAVGKVNLLLNLASLVHPEPKHLAALLDRHRIYCLCICGHRCAS